MRIGEKWEIKMLFIHNDMLKELNKIQREITEVYHGVYLELGISSTAFSILYALVDLGDGCRQIDIVKAYFISKQTINSSIKNLVKNGYVELKSSKGNDRLIFLTPKGRQLVEKKIYPFFEVENSVIDELSKEEQLMFVLLMKKYLQKLKEKTKK